MDCTATSTGFACVLDETTAQLRFTTRSEAEDELRTIARRHGFELKVRSSRSTAVYLCCQGAADCSFQAKLSNTSRDAMDAWSIALTRSEHNHPLPPRPTQTEPSALWTAFRRAPFERELEQLSELSDAQRSRAQPTTTQEEHAEEHESESELEAAESASSVESLVAGLNATEREPGVLEKLLRVPLPASLAALDTIRESNHIEAELVHLRIQQLLAIIRDMRNT